MVDNRKLVSVNEPTLGEGEVFSKYKIMYMDEFVDALLREEILFGITLPRLPKRHQIGKEYEYKSPIENEYFELYGEKKKENKTDSSDDDNKDDSSDNEEMEKEEAKPQKQESEDVEMTPASNEDQKPKIKDENSIEYWNEIRARQGLKLLKEPEPKEKDSQIEVKSSTKTKTETDIYK